MTDTVRSDISPRGISEPSPYHFHMCQSSIYEQHQRSSRAELSAYTLETYHNDPPMQVLLQIRYHEFGSQATNLARQISFEQSYCQRNLTSHLQLVCLIDHAFFTRNILGVTKDCESTDMVGVKRPLAGIGTADLAKEYLDTVRFTYAIFCDFRLVIHSKYRPSGARSSMLGACIHQSSHFQG